MNAILKYFSLGIACLFFASCEPNLVYSQFQSVENHEWSFDNKLLFLMNNTDTISKKNVFINIRNDKDYPFSAIFLIGKIEFPQGTVVTDTLEFEMTDSAGRWLGTGFTDIKENKLFYKESVVFDEQGTYKIVVQQATRGINDIQGEQPLKGILDVGISIEKE